jgi:membrane protein required for beta-lactamase induction
MLIFGFLDGFFFSFFLLLMLLVFVVYRIGRSVIGNPLKAIGWAKSFYAILHDFTGHQEGGR